jgi:hypothetical protein
MNIDIVRLHFILRWACFSLYFVFEYKEISDLPQLFPIVVTNNKKGARHNAIIKANDYADG